MGRSPRGVAMGVSGDAHWHWALQNPSLPHAQHPESDPPSGEPIGPPGGRHGADGSNLKRQVPALHGFETTSESASAAPSAAASPVLPSGGPPSEVVNDDPPQP